MKLAGIFAALCAVTGAGAAAAAGLAAPPAAPAAPVNQGCDFFEAQLISYLCGHTAFVAPGGDAYDYQRSFNVAVPGGTRVDRNESRQGDEGLTVAVDPWQGLRLTLGGSALQYNNTRSEQFAPAAIGPVVRFAPVNGSQAGRLSLGAEYTLWDNSNASGRYIFNLVGNLETNPGGGPFAQRNIEQIGWASGAKWRLGAGYSLNYTSSTLFQHYDNPGELRVSSTSRLLVAADDWGVAVGPRLVTTAELWHPQGVNIGWSSVSLGGEALLEPFRATRVAVLRDMTLDVYGQRSIGQAALVPNWNGSTTTYEYGASARFNFQY